MRVESFDCGSTGSCRKPEFLLRFEPCWPTVGNTVDWPTVVNTVSWPIVVDAVGISQSIPSTQIYTPSSLRCPIKCARVFIHLRQKAQNKVHANPSVGVSRVRSWSRLFVLGAISWAFIAKY